MNRCFFLLLMLLSTTALAGHGDAPLSPTLRVVYPQQESRQDPRALYPLAILQLALERSGVPYVLQPSPTPTQQARSLRQLASGQTLDIAWSETSRERERHLLPIRIPIERGLIGWRVLLIRAGDAGRFRDIDSKAQLESLRGGQGHDWPDLGVLRENGLTVLASPTYDGLFSMLERGRIDYFPRSVTEVEAELARHAGRPIEIEPHLLLHYRAGLYFFVNPRAGALADAVTRGLERSLADGSLRRLFETTYGASTRSLQLRTRRIIELDNPELPDDMPLPGAPLRFVPGEQP